jgi:hypothetical protein
LDGTTGDRFEAPEKNRELSLHHPSVASGNTTAVAVRLTRVGILRAFIIDL